MAGDFSHLCKQFDRAAHLEYPNGQSTQGWKSADNFWMGLRSAFPDAVFTIHHQMGIDSPDMSPRSALRWSLHGKHSGWGISFGAPTSMPRSMSWALPIPNTDPVGCAGAGR